MAEHNGIVLDISRQKVTTETMGLLSTLFEEQEVAKVSEAHPLARRARRALTTHAPPARKWRRSKPARS